MLNIHVYKMEKNSTQNILLFLEGVDNLVFMLAIQISNHLRCIDRCSQSSMRQILHKISQVNNAQRFVYEIMFSLEMFV